MYSITKLSDLQTAVLYEIDLAANLSFAEIGRRIGVSKVAVVNAIERLKQEKIITGYSPVINVSKMGHSAYAVFLKLKNISKVEYNNLINQISSLKTVHGIAECGGPYDVMFALNTEDIYSLNESIAKLQQQFSKYFLECRISTRISVHYFTRAYLARKANLPRKATFVRRVCKKTEEAILDDIDKSILNILGKNARISITDIASQLKTTRTTVHKRIKLLETNKVILGYLAQIQSPNFGAHVFQILIYLQNKSPLVVDELVKWASNEKSIIHFVHVIANWDIEITCEVENQNEMQEIIRRLWSSGQASISNIEISLVFKLFQKYSFSI